MYGTRASQAGSADIYVIRAPCDNADPDKQRNNDVRIAL